MRKLSLLALAGVMPLLAGCVIYSHEGGERVTIASGEAVTAASAQLEPVSQLRLDGQSLSVVVGSNGCTDISSFEVRIEESQPASLSLVRRQPDLCKAIVAEGVRLSWTYEELGVKAGQAVRVMNPQTF